MSLKNFRTASTVRSTHLRPICLGTIAMSGLFCAIVGLAVLVVHSETPGAKGITPVTWPRDSRLVHSKTGVTLLVFLHPHCPCGRATVNQLEQLIYGQQGMRTNIVLLKPTKVAPGWERGLIHEMCLSLKDVHILIDDAGREARRFDIATSGHVCLYDENQQLLYSGGITRARAHEGGNAGIDALRSILTGGRQMTGIPVFGCPLFSHCDSPAFK